MADQQTRTGAAPIAPTDTAQPAVSDDDKAKAAATQPPTPTPTASDKFVRFNGPRNIVANADALKTRSPRLGEATQATISPADWAKAGLSGDKTLVWNLFNNYRIPASEFTPQQLDYLLTHSKRFDLVDSAGNKIKR